MTRPYSMDLRERVVAAVEADQSCHAVAKLFNLGAATVVRWVDRQRTSGACAPKPMGGIRHAVLLPEHDWLLARIAAVPDATVRGLRAELAERGTKVQQRRRLAVPAQCAPELQKKSAGGRAGSARRCPQARTMETISGSG